MGLALPPIRTSGSRDGRGVAALGVPAPALPSPFKCPGAPCAAPCAAIPAGAMQGAAAAGQQSRVRARRKALTLRYINRRARLSRWGRAHWLIDPPQAERGIFIWGFLSKVYGAAHGAGDGRRPYVPAAAVRGQVVSEHGVVVTEGHAPHYQGARVCCAHSAARRPELPVVALRPSGDLSQPQGVRRRRASARIAEALHRRLLRLVRHRRQRREGLDACRRGPDDCGVVGIGGHHDGGREIFGVHRACSRGHRRQMR